VAELLEQVRSGDSTALVRLAEALEVPAVRHAVLDELGAAEAQSLASALEAIAGAPASAEATGETQVAPGSATPAPSAGRRRRDRLRDAAAMLRRAPEIAAPEIAAPGVTPAASLLQTSCGGIALVYPWLGTLLREAVAARPALDPVAARRHALAAIAGTPAAPDDALVRLLAGDELRADAAPLGDDPDSVAASEAADALLGRFAGALPGFERSTPEFVRRELIIRPGWIEPESEPVTIALAPAALDVVLVLLPYPVGLFRLPWTERLSIRIEQAT